MDTILDKLKTHTRITIIDLYVGLCIGLLAIKAIL